MRKEIWFFHRLGLIEIVIAAIAISGITTIGGIWVTTAAKSVYANPMGNLPTLFWCWRSICSSTDCSSDFAARRQYAS